MIVIFLEIPNQNYFFKITQDKENSQYDFWQEIFDEKRIGVFKRLHENYLTRTQQNLNELIFNSESSISHQKVFLFQKHELQTNKNSQNTFGQEYLKYKQYCLDEAELIANNYPSIKQNNNFLKTQKNSSRSPTIFALDCEMVTTQEGLELARISLIDSDSNILLNKFVKPENEIIDYNYKYSGLTQELIDPVIVRLKDIQKEFFELVFEDDIIIGHSLENDLNALHIIHENCIDTSILYIQKGNRKQSLKYLALSYLKCSIQQGVHDSIDDAKISLAMAKLRIDIFEPIQNMLENQSLSFDILKRINQNVQSIQFFAKSGQNNSKQMKKYSGLLLLNKNIFIIECETNEEIFQELIRYQSNLENQNIKQLLQETYIFSKKLQGLLIQIMKKIIHQINLKIKYQTKKKLNKSIMKHQMNPLKNYLIKFPRIHALL